MDRKAEARSTAESVFFQARRGSRKSPTWANPRARSTALTAMIDDIVVSFPGGKRVDASVGGRVVHTDQPSELGGEGTAAAPYDLFLAAMATCAGIYALGFCQSRGLSTEGLAVTQRHEVDPESKLPTRVRLDVTFPEDFPEKYRAALLRAVEGCKVKKTITKGLAFEVAATT